MQPPFHALSGLSDERAEFSMTGCRHVVSGTGVGGPCSGRPPRMVQCRQWVWQSRYLAIRTMSRSIAVSASSADGRPQMRLPECRHCAKACSTRAIRGPTPPIGGQRDLPDQVRLRQPHPSQEAERPRYAETMRRANKENRKSARVSSTCLPSKSIEWGYSSELSGNGQSRLQHQTPSLPAQPRHRLTGLCYAKGGPLVSIPNSNQAKSTAVSAVLAVASRARPQQITSAT